MSSSLDYGKAKRRRRAKFGERIDRNTRGTGPSRSWRNLRTEWDGPEFPVVTTRLTQENPLTCTVTTFPAQDGGSVTETLLSAAETSQDPGQGRYAVGSAHLSQHPSQRDAAHGTVTPVAAQVVTELTTQEANPKQTDSTLLIEAT